MHSKHMAAPRRPFVLVAATLLSLGLLACGSSAPSSATAATTTPVVNTAVPAAVLTGISPVSVAVGTATTVGLSGTGFVSTSMAQINGAARATLYVSSTQLTTTLLAQDVAAEGSLGVTVSNAATGGGVSNTQILQVKQPAPSALIGSCSPASAVRGVAGAVTLSGSGFLPVSFVQVNGMPRATTYLDATKLSFVLPDEDVANEGSLSVTVSNAAAGGSVSSAFVLQVVRPLPAVAAISPESVTVGGGDVLFAITGTNLDHTLLQVGASAPYANDSAASRTAASFRVPASEFGKAGSLPVTLLTGLPGSSGYVAVSTGKSVAVVAPEPLVSSINPVDLIRGIPATVTVNGNGFLPSSRVQAGGSDRATTYVSSTQLIALLTAADVSADGPLAISVTNAAVGGKVSAAVSVSVQSPLPSEYHAYGDSITNGATLTSQFQSYPNLVAQQYGMKPVNLGRDGIQTWQIFYGIVLPSDIAPSVNRSVVYSLMSGSNDALRNGSGPQEDIYQSCREAILSWLAVPSESRVLANTKGFLNADGCAFNGGCGSAGTVGVTGFSSAGAPIYVWYVMNERAAQDASFTISVDGKLRGTYSSRPSAVASINKQSTEQTVGVIRLAADAGQHDITIATTTGDVNILGFGTLPALDYGTKPVLLVGDFPNTQPDLTSSSLTLQQMYSADIRAAAALLAADGLDVRLVPTRRYLLGQTVEYTDEVHPNALGHQHLAQAFSDVLGKPGSRPAVTTLSGSATALPAEDMVNIAPGAAQTYTLPEVANAGRIVTVFNRGTAAATVTPAATDKLELLVDGAAISTTPITNVLLNPGHSVTFFPDTPSGSYNVAIR